MKLEGRGCPISFGSKPKFQNCKGLISSKFKKNRNQKNCKYRAVSFENFEKYYWLNPASQTAQYDLLVRYSDGGLGLD